MPEKHEFGILQNDLPYLQLSGSGMPYSGVKTHAELRLFWRRIQSSPDPGGRELLRDEAVRETLPHQEGAMERTENLVDRAETPAHAEQLPIQLRGTQLLMRQVASRENKGERASHLPIVAR